MNNDKRIFALVSLGLLLAALLVPFLIAAFGKDDLALGFGAVAGLLALLFGALSWTDRIGRTVTVTLLLLLLAGGVGIVALSSIQFHQMKAAEDRARAAAEAERALAEAARQK